MKIVVEFEDFADMMEFVKQQAPLIEPPTPMLEPPAKDRPPDPAQELHEITGSSLSLLVRQKLMAAGFTFIEQLLKYDDEYLLWEKHLDGDTIRELREWKAPT